MFLIPLILAASLQKVVPNNCTFDEGQSKLVCDDFQQLVDQNTSIAERVVTLHILNSTIDVLPYFNSSTWQNLEHVWLDNTENLNCAEIEKLLRESFFHVVHDNKCQHKTEAACVLNFYNSLICTNVQNLSYVDETIKDRILFLDIIDSELIALPNFTAEGWSKLEFVGIKNVRGISCDDIQRQKSMQLFIEHDLLCDSSKYFIPRPYQEKCSTIYGIALQCINTNELPIIKRHAANQIIFVDLKLSAVQNLTNFIRLFYPNTEYITLVQTPEINCSEIQRLQELGIYVEHDNTCNRDATTFRISTETKPISLALTQDANHETNSEKFQISYTKTEFYQLIALLVICSFILILKGSAGLMKFVQKLRQRKQENSTRRKSNKSFLYMSPTEQTVE